jgi:hypothetical protein
MALWMIFSAASKAVCRCIAIGTSQAENCTTHPLFVLTEQKE